MFSSVKEGLKHVESEKFFLTPGDHPLVKKDTYAALANTEGDIVIPVYKGIKGHPVLMKSAFINQILQGSEYASLWDFIKEREITLVDTDDPGILVDIDTLSDYERALQFYSESAVR
jgi:molybdenum cofactor cytidylyltransferase